MAARRYVDVFEAYDRFTTGQRMTEKQWDNEVIPQKASMLKEVYDIDFGGEIVSTDAELNDRLFLAGMDMLLSCGVFNTDTGRVMMIQEDEIYQGLKMAPKKLPLGTGKDKVKCKPRRGNAVRRPIVEGGPTGAPVSEPIFEKLIESYAVEPMVDGIVSGIIKTIDGHPAVPNSPWEIKATMAEIRHVREATSFAGRAGMCI